MPLWGCIADDYTGATDLATNFVSQGFRTVVVFGAPGGARREAVLAETSDADVVVVALKSRTAPPAEAVADSLAALEFLQSLGTDRYYVKYCSTFDSTPRGNIGPVIDAVLERLDQSTTVVVPSFPRAGRTLYQGTLFVGSQRLDESSMRHHPLTPMLDSSVPRLLEAQTANEVGLITLATVRSGSEAVRHTLEDFPATGRNLIVVDAIDDDDLRTIADATTGLRVVTGGSGLALGYRQQGDSATGARRIAIAEGRRAVLCGSASQMTRAQVAHGKVSLPWQKIDVRVFRDDFDAAVADAVSWAAARWHDDPDAIPLFFSVETLDDIRPDDPEASESVERALAAIARGLVGAGARRMIVAGGETSGRVVGELDIASVAIGAEIAPGVAWSSAIAGDGTALNLVLKSGNFGHESMFTTAWEVLA